MFVIIVINEAFFLKSFTYRYFYIFLNILHNSLYQIISQQTFVNTCFLFKTNNKGSVYQFLMWNPKIEKYIGCSI